MKICFVTENIAEFGGRQRVLTVVANALAESNNIEVSILFTSLKEIMEKQVYELNPKIIQLWEGKIAKGKKSYIGYKIIRTFNKKVYSFKNVELLKGIYFPGKEIKSYQKFFSQNIFDVVIGVGTRPSAMLSLLNNKHKKIAWLHTSYNTYFNTPGCFQWKQELLYHKLLPNLDKMVVLTDNDVNVYNNQFNNNPIRIYNPLSFESSKKSDLKGNKLLFVGRLDYEIKGLGLLIKSLKKLKELVPNFILTVVGDGRGKERFLKEAIEAGVIDNIKMIGATTQVIKYYISNSICVLPSTKEGFGLVVTEAMECGLPVISYKTEGPSEIIEDGINGFLVEKFDTDAFALRIAELCFNSTKRKEMSENAINRAKDFSVNNIKTEWIKMLESIIKR